jgi:hypothetical protein
LQYYKGFLRVISAYAEMGMPAYAEMGMPAYAEMGMPAYAEMLILPRSPHTYFVTNPHKVLVYFWSCPSLIMHQFRISCS